MTAPIPEVLNTPEFRVKWAGFLEDRVQRKKKATERAQETILKKMAPWGPVRAVKALDASIERGWTGVFEPKPEVHELGMVQETPYTEEKVLKLAKHRAISDLEFCGMLTPELDEKIRSSPVISEVSRFKAERFREFAQEVEAWSG